MALAIPMSVRAAPRHLWPVRPVACLEPEGAQVRQQRFRRPRPARAEMQLLQGARRLAVGFKRRLQALAARPVASPRVAAPPLVVSRTQAALQTPGACQTLRAGAPTLVLREGPPQRAVHGPISAVRRPASVARQPADWARAARPAGGSSSGPRTVQNFNQIMEVQTSGRFGRRGDRL